jgi:hypothetical protein
VVSFNTRSKDTQFFQNKTQESIILAVSFNIFKKIHSKHLSFRNSFTTNNQGALVQAHPEAQIPREILGFLVYIPHL